MEIVRVDADSSGYVKVTYALSSYDKAAERYIDITRERLVDPQRSALVVVDVWNIDFLDSMIIGFINPLIEEFDRLGAKIIYARSQNPHSSKLLITEESITFSGVEIMDDYLSYHGIENLFYVGFDTYYCVADKPNGIYPFRLRNHRKIMNMFVFEQGVASYTEEMKETAMSLFKKHNVGVVRLDSVEYGPVHSKKTIRNVFATTACQMESGNNFVLIFKNDKVNKALVEFEDFLTASGAEYGVIYGDSLTYKDRVLTDIYELMQIFKRLEIRNVYYCGNYLNDEILWSQFGITPLYIKKRYSGLRELPEIYVINDLSYIIPSSSIDPELEKAVVINHYRDIKNILSATLMSGLRRNYEAVPPFLDTLQHWRSWPFLEK